MTPLEQHRLDVQALALRIMQGAQDGTIILTDHEHNCAQVLGFFNPGNAVATLDGIIPLDEIPIILLTPDGPT